MAEKKADIIVAGTGPAGMMAGIALAQAGFNTCLVGPPVNRRDGRTTTLMVPALEFLDRLGVLEALRPRGAPLRAMRIVDVTSRLIRAPAIIFRAAEIGQEMFGLNIPNAALNAELETRARATDGLEWREGLVEAWAPSAERVMARIEDGTTIAARLAVAADGRGSLAREASGITVRVRPLPQSALVLNFTHSRGHADTSTEFHTEEGPFTQVPLPGDRSSLVWVVKPEHAAALAGLDAAALSRAVEERMRSMLGRVRVDSEVQTYPLSTYLPSAFARDRIALVGEAAHVFPPIGAQGLNLGVRDVRDLRETALRHSDDPGAPAALRAYDFARRPDILARTSAVSLLNASLLSGMLPAQLARGATLALLGAVPPLRTFFMREGLEPGSGWRFPLRRPGPARAGDAAPGR